MGSQVGRGVQGEVEVHKFTYDPNGQKETYTDAKQRVTHYDYDNRNRLHLTTEDPAPGASPFEPRVTITDHDGAGNKTWVTFPDGKTQHWNYYDPVSGKRRRLKRTTTRYESDLPIGCMKKLATVTTHREMDDEGGGDDDQSTSFVYDGMGRLTRVVFPDLTDEVTTYGAGAT